MKFEYANREFCEMLGVSSEALYKDIATAFSRIHPEEYEAFVHLNREVIKNQQPFSWEGRVIVDDQIKWIRIASIPELQNDYDLIWSGVQIDITDQKLAEKALQDANSLLAKRLAEIEKLQAQLHDQAVRDYLTGLYNRRYLDETMEREVARSNRDARKLSVVMMDIDQFKGVNDIYGHQAGDDVLIALGKMLKENSRSSDIACRYGGDEFVVVMLNASEVDAYHRSQDWLKRFSQLEYKFGDQKFSTTLSMGIATYPLHGSSAQGIFLAADEALYHSKKYNNRVTISRRTATGRLRSIG
jgi:diguanylate cyclase (GGDEF)-like protein/PAS domain S-box-containing protein